MIDGGDENNDAGRHPAFLPAAQYFATADGCADGAS